MSTVRVVETKPGAVGQLECVVKCLEGSIQVADRLVTATDTDHGAGSFEVLEIRYFERLVQVLEENFGGELLLQSHGEVTLPLPGSDLTSASSV